MYAYPKPAPVLEGKAPLQKPTPVWPEVSGFILNEGRAKMEYEICDWRLIFIGKILGKPVLLKNGEATNIEYEIPAKGLRTRNPRSAVCVNEKNEVIFLAADGRTAKSRGICLRFRSWVGIE